MTIVDQVASRGYFAPMRTVGLKTLKNKLRGGARNPGLAGSAPCVLRDGRFRSLLRMRYSLNAIKRRSLILRSAQRARLEGRKTVMQPFV